MKKLFHVIVGSACLAFPTYAQQDSLVEHHLQEVVVVAKLPPVEYSAGKRVYRPDASITQGAGTVYDLLASFPGVVVGEDGVRLNGKTGVRILQDGKPSYLSDGELMNLLRATPATQVEKVEVITQPSARYEAEGTSGIIDIRLRKQKRRGMNLAVNGTGSLGPSGYGYGSLSANLRKGKANFFTNYSYYDGRQRIDMTVGRTGLQERMEQDACQRRHNRSHYARIGTDWDITPRTVWSLSTEGNLWRQDEQAEMYSELLPSGEAERTESHSKPLRKHWTASTSLVHRLPADRGEVTATFDYFRYHRAEIQEIRSSGPSLVEGDNEGDIRLVSGRVDAVYSLNGYWKLSGGLKANRAHVSNRSAYRREGKSIRPSESSYVESIRAAYLQSEYGRDIWKGALGLRVEQTELDGHTDWHLFPSFFGQYGREGDDVLQFSYTRRISRPGYDALSPFVHVMDRYTYETGNPALCPSFSDHVELEYVHRNKLHAALFFSLTDDEIQPHYRMDGEWTACVSPLNFAGHLQSGVRMNVAEVSLFLWWTAHATVQLTYDRYHWEEPGEARRENSRFTPSAHILSQFALSAKW